jgi:hypothetical protein
VLSLFRDAPTPNVPCVFEGGQYNMLAADGSRCGTSPAWCLPFLQLEHLYLRTLDRAWLEELFPYAAAFVRWWLAERTDSQAWAVYRCTWESGEDGNPRLDPTGSGDAVIADRVRPVELQAALAHAARVMAFFAAELGRETREWRAIEEVFRARTRQLFDPAAGRYRDWLVAEARFQEPCSTSPYWGVDACRWSPQALTPLLLGETLAAEEIWAHATPPWTCWPSWTTTLVESAAADSDRHIGRISALARQLIEHVYTITTRREVDALLRPLPGSAPEFWPADWSTYDGNDAYGWGATSATLLLRHLVGLKESRQTDGWVLELTPALPDEWRRADARLTVGNLSYRDLRFDLSYEADANGSWLTTIDLGAVRRQATVEVLGTARAEAWEPVCQTPTATRHSFVVTSGRRYRLRFESSV